MTEGLMPQFDYSNLNLRSLKYLYTKNPKNDAVKYRVFETIITKFFELRKAGDYSFNAYQFFREKNRLDVSMRVTFLSMELEFDDIASLPSELHEGFFWLLTETVQELDKKKLNSEGEFDWQLASPSRIAELLSKVSKANIKDVTLLAKLNQLMAIVEKAMEAAENERLLLSEPEITETGLVKKEQPQAPEMKKIKIVASQLTKRKAQEIFQYFGNYDEETQTQIINISIKKWKSLDGLDPHYVFRHLRRYPADGFDMIKVIESCLSTYSRPHEVLKYENLESMLDDLSEWYTGLSNATETGRAYFIHLLRVRCSGNDGSSAIKEFQAQQYLLPALDNLRPFMGKSWLSLFQSEITHKKTYALCDFSCRKVEDGRFTIEEPDFDTSKTVSGSTYLFSMYQKMNNRLIDADITTRNDSYPDKLVASSYSHEIKEFCSIIKGFTLNGDDLATMYSLINPGKGYIRTGSDNQLQNIFYTYMCNNDLTPEQAFDLINTPEKVKAFHYCTHIRSNYGSYHSSADFVSAVLVKAIDLISLKDDESLKLFAELLDDVSCRCLEPKINIHQRAQYDFSLGELILRKLQEDRPEIHNALMSYMEPSMLSIFEIKDFIGTFL